MQGRSSSTQFWAIVLIGLGVVLLLGSLIPNLWGLLWPLFLVALGLYLLLGRGRVMFGSPDLKTDRFSAPLAGVTSARVELGLPVGETDIHTLADAENLIDAELTYVGEIDFAVSGEAEKTVRLRQAEGFSWNWLNPANWFSGGPRPRWSIGLSPHVPMSLSVSGGVGASRLDLRALQVTNLDISTGTGAMSLVMPGVSDGYQARLSGGVGEMRAEIPDGATVGLSLSGGVGSVTLQIGAGAAINARITGGAGRVYVDVPPDAAVRLEASTGLGDIAVPGRFARLSGAEGGVGQSGVWETPGFAEAARPIAIHFSGGVGGLAVR